MFLKSYLGIKAPGNDLGAFKDVFNLSKEYPELAQSLMKRIHNHPWFFSQQL